MKKTILTFIAILHICLAYTAYPTLPLGNNYNTYFFSDKMADAKNHLWAVYNDTIVVYIDKESGNASYAPFEMPRDGWQEILNNQDELNKEWILALRTDNNNLYIGGTWRVCKFDGKTLSNVYSAVEYPKYFPSEPWPPSKINHFTEIAFRNDTIFASGHASSTKYYTLVKARNSLEFKTIDNIEVFPSYLSETVGLKVDSKGNLWNLINHAGSKMLLYKIDYGSFSAKLKHAYNFAPYSYDHAQSLTIDKDDNVWFTTRNNNIFCYSPLLDSTILYTHDNYPDIPANVRFTSSNVDNSGNLWFCADSVLMKYDGEHFNTFTCEGIKNAICILPVNDTIWVYRSDNMITRFVENNSCDTFSLDPNRRATTEINEAAQSTQMQITYSHQSLCIRSQEPIGCIDLYDTLGRKVTQYHCSANTLQLPIALPSGVYIVRTDRLTEKIVIE